MLPLDFSLFAKLFRQILVQFTSVCFGSKTEKFFSVVDETSDSESYHDIFTIKDLFNIHVSC